MDQYTSDLLTKWGLVEYVDTFSAARIDIMTLQLLEPNDIRLLISPIGDQLRFKSNFELWKREMNVCTANVDAEAFDTSQKLVDLSFSSGVLDLDNVTDENTNNNDKNTVLAILNKTPEGRAIVVKGERNGGLLSPELRKEIANLIINHELGVDRSKIITGPEFLNFAHEIKAIFKEESPAVFYAPYLAQTNFQPKRNASGLLYNAYGTKKKHLRQLGALPPASRSRSRSRSSVRSDTPETYLPLCGIQLSLLDEGEARIVEDKLLLLQSPVPGPWQSVEEIWTETTAARLRFLYYEKGTLNDYLERFPVLKSANGYKLLIKDYEKLYPNKSNGLTVLLDSAKRIVRLANSKLSSIKDAKVKLTIKEYIESIDTNVEDSELNACLLLLAYIINITPVRRKNSWKASRTEFRDGFITHVASESDVLTSIDERRIKLRDLGVTFQPLVIYCGESIKTIQKVFVVCETTLYEFQSLSKGVDTAFKIFHATGSQYPQESYDIWLLIQIAFYEVQTKYDRPTAAVKQTLVDLGLKNRLK